MRSHTLKAVLARKGRYHLITWQDMTCRWYGISHAGCSHRIACFPGVHKGEKRRTASREEAEAMLDKLVAAGRP